MSEAESTALAIREVYSAYYSEMGGVGAAPEPKARTATTKGKVVRVERRSKPQPASLAARNSTGPMIRKSLAALLIFASLVALIVTYMISDAVTDQRRGLCVGTMCCFFSAVPRQLLQRPASYDLQP